MFRDESCFSKFQNIGDDKCIIKSPVMILHSTFITCLSSSLLATRLVYVASDPLSGFPWQNSVASAGKVSPAITESEIGAMLISWSNRLDRLSIF